VSEKILSWGLYSFKQAKVMASQSPDKQKERNPRDVFKNKNFRKFNQGIGTFSLTTHINKYGE
jgi:hypothetical protein